MNREEEDKGKERAANVKQDSTDDGQLQGVVIGVRVQHTKKQEQKLVLMVMEMVLCP